MFLNFELLYCFQGSSKNSVQEWDDPLLLLSTLDGSFYGVGQKTGYVRWTLKDGEFESGAFINFYKSNKNLYLFVQN